MRLSEQIYKLTGVEYRTNSNVYAVRYDGGLILIDTGFQNEQWERMKLCMSQWKLRLEDVTHVFITHSHFDHAGNVWRANLLGANVFSSEVDTEKIEHGNPEMEKLFEAKWHCGKVDKVIREGDTFEFPGKIKIEVLETPGHCKGALSFRILTDNVKALCTGDMFFIKPKAPEDDVEVELGYMGSEDFCMGEYKQSLKKLEKLDTDLFLPGHYYTYRSDNINEIFKMAYKSAQEIER